MARFPDTEGLDPVQEDGAQMAVGNMPSLGVLGVMLLRPGHAENPNLQIAPPGIQTVDLAWERLLLVGKEEVYLEELTLQEANEHFEEGKKW